METAWQPTFANRNARPFFYTAAFRFDPMIDLLLRTQSTMRSVGSLVDVLGSDDDAQQGLALLRDPIMHVQYETVHYVYKRSTSNASAPSS